MRIDRLGPVHRLDKRELAEGVVEMVVAADDVRHAHVVIVHDHREHIGGGAIGAQQDIIVEFARIDGDVTLDLIGNRHLARLRGLQPHDIGRARRGFTRIAVAPAAVIAHRQLLLALLGAHRLQLLRGGEALVSLAHIEQLVRNLGMARRALALEYRCVVPIETQPVEPGKDRVDRFRGRARLVGILDAQQRLAAMVAGEQPVEHRGARAADMQESGGRRGEPGYDLTAGRTRRKVRFFAACTHLRFPFKLADDGNFDRL